jgi:hypothetical protein
LRKKKKAAGRACGDSHLHVRLLDGLQLKENLLRT